MRFSVGLRGRLPTSPVDSCSAGPARRAPAPDGRARRAATRAVCCVCRAAARWPRAPCGGKYHTCRRASVLAGLARAAKGRCAASAPPPRRGARQRTRSAGATGGGAGAARAVVAHRRWHRRCRTGPAAPRRLGGRAAGPTRRAAGFSSRPNRQSLPTMVGSTRCPAVAGQRAAPPRAAIATDPSWTLWKCVLRTQN